MPTVTIKRQSNKTAPEAYAKVKLWLAEDKDLAKLDSGYKCQFDDDRMTGQATGKKFKANMAVKSSSAGSEVEIVVDLPFTLALAKGLIEKTIHKKLDASLA